MKVTLGFGLMLIASAVLIGQQSPTAPGGAEYVPEAWYPHPGGVLQYRVNQRFGTDPNSMPAGWSLGRVSAVTTNSKGEVYAFQRGDRADPVIVFDAQGKFVRSWGKGLFANPHGIRADKDDNIWTIDTDIHQVSKFTPDGKLIQSWGIRGQSGTDEKTFNRPADVVFAKDGGFYVSDGYGNSRIVQFDKDGKYVRAWGERGTGPGQFNNPHSAAVDSKGRVYVADRNNNRIQIFTADGQFIKQWTHLGAPQGVYITPTDEVWVLAARNNVESAAWETMVNLLMKVDLETGKILGSVESPGHLFTVTNSGEVFVANLAGTVLRWYPSPLGGRGRGGNPGTPQGTESR